jgi:hypothetical protein
MPAIHTMAFAAGAVVMTYEILGMRDFAWNFGTGIVAWGSVIGVFMAGLAAGYYAGGLVAERRPRFCMLAWVVTPAALAIVLFPRYVEPFCTWLYPEDVMADLRWPSLLGATGLFFLPSCLLGMVSPLLVQLVVRDARHAGKGAGTLYAVSTGGSIVGTLGAAFYLVLLGTSTGLVIAALVLTGVAALAVVCDWADVNGNAQDEARQRRRTENGPP